MPSLNIRDLKKPNIYLVGMMGTGKSTIGNILAAKMRMNFIDSDQSIEESFGQSVSEIFSKKGEGFFRKLEHDFIAKGHHTQNYIVSCGGGLCIPTGMMELLKSRGKVICLWATPETIISRTKNDHSRPLLQVAHPFKQLKKIIKERESRYREADHFINTEGLAVEQVVDSIMTVIGSS